MKFRRIFLSVILFSAGLAPPAASALQQRDEVSYLRGPYNGAFFHRQNEAFRIGAAIHFAHGKAHDVLQLSPFQERERTDASFDAECVGAIRKPPHTEPVMELYGPYTAQFVFDLYRAIDWTHMHHEQTYDVLSARGIPWSEKARWTERAVQYYLQKFDIPRSPAPLDVTMRRAAVMMKPYFSLFRNYYPKSNNFFYAAHWWHPAIYEAQMLGGNGGGQETIVRETDRIFREQVLADRPKRMMLSREMMPKYARLSPESANIFDNLHMLHGIAYDILAYEGWTEAQKRAELERVIRAMSYQPGDEKLARKFQEERPDVDPRVYEDWMKGSEGDMTRIMLEMWEEMSPLMMPQDVPEEMKKKAVVQVRKKLAPGIEEGEEPGSLMDAMKKLMPDMKMTPESMEPGGTPQKMIDAMLEGWRKKHGGMSDVAPVDMAAEPTPQSSGRGGEKR